MDAMIRDFSLSLASDGKKPKTIRTYTDAAAWLQKTQGMTHWASISRSAIREHMALLRQNYRFNVLTNARSPACCHGEDRSSDVLQHGRYSAKLADSGVPG